MILFPNLSQNSGYIKLLRDLFKRRDEDRGIKYQNCFIIIQLGLKMVIATWMRPSNGVYCVSGSGE